MVGTEGLFFLKGMSLGLRYDGHRRALLLEGVSLGLRYCPTGNLADVWMLGSRCYVPGISVLRYAGLRIPTELRADSQVEDKSYLH